jgi:hypothetical protein
MGRIRRAGFGAPVFWFFTESEWGSWRALTAVCLGMVGLKGGHNDQGIPFQDA